MAAPDGGQGRWPVSRHHRGHDVGASHPV